MFLSFEKIPATLLVNSLAHLVELKWLSFNIGLMTVAITDCDETMVTDEIDVKTAQRQLSEVAINSLGQV